MNHSWVGSHHYEARKIRSVHGGLGIEVLSSGLQSWCNLQFGALLQCGSALGASGTSCRVLAFRVTASYSKRVTEEGSAEGDITKAKSWAAVCC